MKLLMIFILGALQFASYSSNNKSISTAQVEDDYKNFKLTYSYAGLGSGFGSLQPTFRVKGLDYTYTLEQNSYRKGSKKKEPELLSKGKLRPTSVDSIRTILKNKDTTIYRTNTGIMSGGVHEIFIKDSDLKVTFTLHNASDSIAEQIVNILNSNITFERKLWLFKE